MAITTTVRKNNSSGEVLCTENGRSVNSPISYNGSQIQAGFSGAKTCNCKDMMMAGNVVIGSKTLNCKDTMMPYNVWVQNTSTDPQIISGALSLYDNRTFTVRNSDGSGSSSTMTLPCSRISGDVRSGYFRSGSSGGHYGVVINNNEIYIRGLSKIITMIKSDGYTYVPYENGRTPTESRLSIGNQITVQTKTISSGTKLYQVDGTSLSLHYIDIPYDVKCGAYWGDNGETYFMGPNQILAPLFGFSSNKYLSNVINENGHTYIPVISNTTTIYYAQFAI